MKPDSRLFRLTLVPTNIKKISKDFVPGLMESSGLFHLYIKHI